MSQRQRVIALLGFLIAGIIAIAYNIILLMASESQLGSRYAYLVLGLVLIIVSVYIYKLVEPAGSHQVRLPRVCTLEDADVLPALSSEQLYTIQRMFQDYYRVRIESLEGGYSNFGVFRVIPETSERLLRPGVVVKYLTYRDIRQEKTAFRTVLDRYPLSHTPGRPLRTWPPDHQLSDSSRIGAVSYQLTMLNPDSQLQTLKDVYKQQSFEVFIHHVKLLFETLDRWYALRLPETEGLPLGGPDGVYERLYRRRDDIRQGIRELIQLSSNSGASAVSPDELGSKKTIELPFLPEEWRIDEFYNPLFWVNNVFTSDQAACFKAVSPYSPVHGDLHTENVIIEKGKDTHIWLIDFPNAHIGPSLQDFATMEADVKFNLVDMERCSFDDWLRFEHRLLFPLSSGHETLDWPWSQDWQPKGEELLKAWRAVGFLRCRAKEHRLIGEDIRGYYLALLHNTLPVVYRDTHTETQKQCALTSAAWMCRHLSS